MGSYSKIILIANLGTDPEIKSFGDSEVCNFSVAVNPFAKKGQDKPDPIWYRIAVWGRQASACEQYLFKGKQVYIEGELTPREYESGGETRTSLDVRANVVQFLGGKGDGSGGGSGQSEPRENLRPQADMDEDIPF